METFLVVCGASFLMLVILLGISDRRTQYRRRWLRTIHPPHTLYADNEWSQSRLRVVTPFAMDDAKWQKGILFLTNKRIVAYPLKPTDPPQPLFEFAPHQIEGFWRPQKYTDGDNTIWLHMNADEGWQIVQVTLTKSRMQALVRALKELVSEDTVRAYRQRRPYIYRAPQTAHIATQNLQGAWELGESFLLYLMPSALVFMTSSQHVERVIALRDLQNIVAVPRVDSTEGGLVRFTLLSTGETHNIALDDYDAWAQAIAQAAKRTLEEPLIRKQKSHIVHDDVPSDRLALDEAGDDFADSIADLLTDDLSPQTGADGEIVWWDRQGDDVLSTPDNQP
jgi:hypothetical protein